jgi:hypothetical protein
MEDHSLVEVGKQLGRIAEMPEVQSDPDLLLLASIAKADVDGELNALGRLRIARADRLMRGCRSLYIRTATHCIFPGRTLGLWDVRWKRLSRQDCQRAPGLPKPRNLFVDGCINAIEP